MKINNVEDTLNIRRLVPYLGTENIPHGGECSMRISRIRRRNPDGVLQHFRCHITNSFTQELFYRACLFGIVHMRSGCFAILRECLLCRTLPSKTRTSRCWRHTDAALPYPCTLGWHFWDLVMLIQQGYCNKEGTMSWREATTTRKLQFVGEPLNTAYQNIL